MEHLVNMRRRIQTIDVTKKITNAMRLISMSMHTRLKDRKATLEYYKNTFYNLCADLSFVLKSNGSESIFGHKDINLLNKRSNLIILVGSQKGLCGVFNSNLFKYFEDYELSEFDHIITVSKYAYDYIKSKNYDILEYYNHFNAINFVHISQSITNLILKNLDLYSQVILFGNRSKTFFIQDPTKNLIYPFDIFNSIKQYSSNLGHEQLYDYTFEQSLSELNSVVEQFMISINIQAALYESLLSEQSARFLSMDAATQNAQNLLNKMKLEYNKLRQANITRELTELSASFNQL